MLSLHAGLRIIFRRLLLQISRWYTYAMILDPLAFCITAKCRNSVLTVFLITHNPSCLECQCEKSGCKALLYASLDRHYRHLDQQVHPLKTSAPLFNYGNASFPISSFQLPERNYNYNICGARSLSVSHFRAETLSRFDPQGDEIKKKLEENFLYKLRSAGLLRS